MNSSQKAINSACRMLGIREHSEKQLRIKLTKKNFNNEEIDHAVKFLYEESWLSNERFCESFIRSKVSKGQGKIRVEFELIQNGVNQDLIEQAFDKANVDWQSECNRVLEKKITNYLSTDYFELDITEKIRKIATSNEKLKFEDRLKIERFMKYRGFENSQIKLAFAQVLVK